jgi:hypothetical protein
MAMFSLSPAQVEEYLISDEFKRFSIGISERLDVQDLFFGIEYKEAEKKFPLKTSLAFSHFENHFTIFDGIYFFINRIASEAEKLGLSTWDRHHPNNLVSQHCSTNNITSLKLGCQEPLMNKYLSAIGALKKTGLT